MPSIYARQPAGGRLGRSSRFLFDWNALDGLDELGRLVARTGQVGAFSRGGTVGAATAVDANGVVHSVANQQPRFHHAYDATTGLWTPRGILLEGSRTNLCLQSQFASGWTVRNSTTTLAATRAPSGATTGVLLKEDGTVGAEHYLESGAAITITNGAVYTVSFFAKAKERTWIALQADGGFGYLGNHQYFDLGNGVAGALAEGVTARRIARLGNGWFRCSLTATATGTSALPLIFLATGDGVKSYNGDNASGLYIWGIQVELGTCASSYIPTTTASVTRSADRLSFACNAVPQVLTMFPKILNLGSEAIDNARFCSLGGDVAPFFNLLNSHPTFLRPRAAHGNGSTSSEATIAAPSAVTGDDVEWRAVLNPDGHVDLGQSINGGSETTATDATAPAFAAAWTAPTLYVGYVPGSAAQDGFIAISQLRLAAGVQSRAYMRAA